MAAQGTEQQQKRVAWRQARQGIALTKKQRKDNKTMKTIEVKITFTEGILGTAPNNEDIYRDFIIEKGRQNGATINELDEQDELDALPEEELEKGMTVFPRDGEGNPCLYDYQVKGFFKDTCGMLKKVQGTRSSGLRAHIHIFFRDVSGLTALARVNLSTTSLLFFRYCMQTRN